MCISVSDFYMKTIHNKHALLYNCPTIHSIQRYYDLCELTNERNVYKGIGFLYENYQQQADTVV